MLWTQGETPGRLQGRRWSAGRSAGPVPAPPPPLPRWCSGRSSSCAWPPPPRLLDLVGVAARRHRRARRRPASATRRRAPRASAAARRSRSPASSAAWLAPSPPTPSSTRSSEELGTGTGADHVAVVRRRPETRTLEAILSPTRAGAPASRTTLPIRELEDPAADRAAAELAIAAARGRRLTAIPIEPDPDGDPDLVPLGLGGRRPGVDRHARRAGPRGGGRTERPSRRSRHGPGAPSTPAPPAKARTSGSPTGSPERLRDAYGLRNLLAAPLRVNGRVEGAHRPVAAGQRAVARQHPAVPRGGGRRGLGRARPRVLPAGCGDAGGNGRAHRPAQPALLRRVPGPPGAPASRRGPGRRADDRHRPLQEAQRHLRACRRRPRAARGRPGDRHSRPRGRRPGPLRWRGVRGPAQEPVARGRGRGGGARSPGGRVLDLRRMGVPGVSVSVGVAVAEEPDVPLDVVIDEADRALYRAKRGGRDRVVAA